MAKLPALFIVFTLMLGLTKTHVASAKTQLTEQFFQGALIVGKTAPENRVMLNGKAIKVSASGDYALGFSRDEKNNSVLTITSPSGEIEKRTLKPLKREYNIQRIEGIAKKIMNPNKKANIRVGEDNKKIKAARTIDSNLTAFAQGFIVPDMFYSGGTMIIDHGHGVSSTFLHLSDAYVNVGDKVVQGQLVAAVGSSGRATGPHLDWRINWFDVRLDPALVLKLTPLK